MKGLAIIVALAGSAQAIEDYISTCQGTYADGKLFAGIDSVAKAGYPAEKTFNVAMHETGIEGDYFTGLNLARNRACNVYTVFKDTLYVDTRPGAFAPVGFKDPSELKDGESSKYWASAYGVTWYAPEDVVKNGVNKDPWYANAASAFVAVDVEGYPGLKQIYWDQRIIEDRLAGGSGGSQMNAFPYCYGSYDPGIVYEDHP